MKSYLCLNEYLKKRRLKNFFFKLIIILLSCCFSIQSGLAADISQLYEASVKVTADKSENELIKNAFSRVLIKVSGRSNIRSSSAYAGLLKKADSAVSQFRYDYTQGQQSKTAAEEENAEENAEENDKESDKETIDKEKWFWVRFNSQIVNSLLTDAAIPVWGGNRPETLLWFSQEINGGRILQSQHDAVHIYSIFKDQAQLRGIALLFPFMDLQDQSAVSSSDLWTDDNEQVLSASRRYQAQSTLTARLFQQTGGLWVSQWTLLILGKSSHWEIKDNDLQQVLALGIDKLADKLAWQFTQPVSNSKQNSVLVQINNINNFKQYQQLDDYLRNLARVKSLTLVQLQQDKIMYEINYMGGENALSQEIYLSDLLKPLENSALNSRQTDSYYKPVILDELDKNTDSNDGQQAGKISASNTSGSHTPDNSVPAVPVILQADLEYWFSG